MPTLPGDAHEVDVVISRTGYLVDACTRPIKVCRPGSRDPSFYVMSVEEAFRVIDLDIALSEEAGYDPGICSAFPGEDAQSPSM